MSRRGVAFLLVGVLAASAGLFLYARSQRGGSRPHRSAPAQVAPEARTAPGAKGRSPRSVPSAGTETGPFDALSSALRAQDAIRARSAAAALRRRIRLDPAVRKEAEAALLSDRTPETLRQALALILGTLPGSDATLLKVLRLEPDAALARCCLLGLGAAREPVEDDDVFGMGGRPWGVPGPGGLGITVDRAVADADARQALAAALDWKSAELRRAAALALRHSLEYSDARAAFLQRVRTEGADSVAAELGESLAGWAADAQHAAARSEVVGALLDRATEKGLDEYRFRMEDDLGRVALSSEHRAVLMQDALADQPFGVRTFAIDVLARSAPANGTRALRETRGLLERLVEHDADPAVRDFSARRLGRLPFDAGSVGVLVRALGADDQWRVRYACVSALRAFVGHASARAALKRAASDANARVAERAKAILARSGG